MNTLKTQLLSLLYKNKESYEDLEIICNSKTLDVDMYEIEDLEINFYAWSKNYVYFIVYSDRGHHISYVPRNPTSNNYTKIVS